MDHVVSRENLLFAHQRVVQNAGAPGVDGMTVQEVMAYCRQHWAATRQKLLAGTYLPRPVRKVEIPKPSGRGMRTLGIPTVLDRLIQQALLQVLTPIFDPTFSDGSFGFRPGRGPLDAVRRAQQHMADGNRWVVDLEKFFDYKFHRADGPYHWANARLVRYADDFVILAKYAGQRIEQFAEQTLQEWMGLQVNRDKTRTVKLHEPHAGLNFLGYTFRYERDHYDRRKRYLHLTVSESSLQRLRDRLKEMTRANQSFTPIRELIERIHRMLRGWQSYFSQGHLRDAYRDVDSYTQRRLIAHLCRRSQRAYKKPSGVTWWDHLQRLGWTPLQKRPILA